MSYTIKIQDVVKTYGDLNAVNHVSLSIGEGEFFTLLGPSGCGKTTLLRMIAGFNSIDGGDIYFGDHRINDIEPHKRNIGMVFQNYAIFPHMDVWDNVAYGLKARNIKGKEQKERVERALEMMKITKFARRSPNQLSGGQQQRVALARSIAIAPDVLLMDEPLSNLDAKLRIEMRTTIRELQKRLNITTIYVTHDQEEALAVSDRIAVMHDGVVEQVGRPEEIYLHPNNAFVANFIGTSNFIRCTVKDGAVRVCGRELELRADGCGDTEAVIATRPEKTGVCANGEGMINDCIVKFKTFLGDRISYEIQLPDGGSVIVNRYICGDDYEVFPEGQAVGIDFNLKTVSVFSEDSRRTLS